MRRFGWIGVALVLILTVVAGSIGYDLGVRHATEAAVAAGGANVTYVVNAGGGFPFFPLLFGFLLFMIMVGFIRRASWAGRRHMAGGWGGPGGREAWAAWCDEHRAGPGTTPGSTPGQNPGAATGAPPTASGTAA